MRSCSSNSTLWGEPSSREAPDDDGEPVGDRGIVPLTQPLSPRGEREPEVPSAKGVITNSRVLPLTAGSGNPLQGRTEGGWGAPRAGGPGRRQMGRSPSRAVDRGAHLRSSHSSRLGNLLSAGRESFSRSMSTIRMSLSQGDPMIPITLPRPRNRNWGRGFSLARIFAFPRLPT